MADLVFRYFTSELAVDFTKMSRAVLRQCC